MSVLTAFKFNFNIALKRTGKWQLRHGA
uniref:Uncharacterized protein n=1 Tax=Anguilla anguilla TaxID=7936 RepID=A0A0E9V3J1_ANGAN